MELIPCSIIDVINTTQPTKHKTDKTPQSTFSMMSVESTPILNGINTQMAIKVVHKIAQSMQSTIMLFLVSILLSFCCY